MKLSQFSLSSLKSQDKLIAVVIFLFFLLLLILELVSAFQPVTKDLQLSEQPLPTIEQEAISKSSPVFTSNLYGAYVPVNLNEADIKESMLDLQIVGILYSPGKKDSQVLIRAAGGEEKNYAEGDTLPGGVIIKHIGHDGIVVLHNGTLESLSLPKNKLRFEKPPKPLIED